MTTAHPLMKLIRKEVERTYKYDYMFQIVLESENYSREAKRNRLITLVYNNLENDVAIQRIKALIDAGVIDDIINYTLQLKYEAICAETSIIEHNNSDSKAGVIELDNEKQELVDAIEKEVNKLVVGGLL